MNARPTGPGPASARHPDRPERHRSPAGLGGVTRRRVVAALAATALAVPAVPTLSPGIAAAAGPAAHPLLAHPLLAGPIVAGPIVAGPIVAGPIVAGQRAATVPCPKPKVAPPANRPKRPVPPADDPALRAVGGADLATSGLIVPPGTRKPPAVTATSWLVADLDSGAVLGGCGPHVHGTPASVQKLLLVATVLPKLDPEQMVKITARDLSIEPGSSAVGLLQGGKYSVKTLWLGLLLNSGNDAANTLARIGGGPKGLAGTVAAMNAEAKRLGAFQTHAVTPSGLDGPGQFTSAYDLALIARACFDHDDFKRYALTEHTQIPAQPPKTKRGFQIQNENKLIYNYSGALGGKTGFTTLARHSYVGAAERGGRRLVVTLLGAEAYPQRGWQQGAALLDWGFSVPEDASVGRLVPPAPAEDEAPTDAQPMAAGTPAVRIASASAPASVTGTSVGIAATVATVLAAAPILLLLSARRRRLRHRVRRHQV
jgi:D-alanyl-D-alanine carboxypeptidase (penicillin-binding protein 5/6)